MDSAKKEIIDKLFRGEMTISIASEELDVSIDEIHNIIDDYEYVPTFDEVCEVQEAILDNLDFLNNEFCTTFNMNIKNADVPTASEVLPKPQFDIGGCEPQLPNANGDSFPFPSHSYDSYYHG
ncbi:hypothetical protein [Methanococcoides sp. NM1]|uniref:hypothetical protein n=1 Tax=Methanococcoides sp. NM1 TaxID=1201013 RepID=UPI0010826EE1|nr:hypothetical protein [Methanococcoides sp. NM1]